MTRRVARQEAPRFGLLVLAVALAGAAWALWVEYVRIDDRTSPDA